LTFMILFERCPFRILAGTLF